MIEQHWGGRRHSIGASGIGDDIGAEMRREMPGERCEAGPTAAQDGGPYVVERAGRGGGERGLKAECEDGGVESGHGRGGT